RSRRAVAADSGADRVSSALLRVRAQDAYGRRGHGHRDELRVAQHRDRLGDDRAGRDVPAQAAGSDTVAGADGLSARAYDAQRDPGAAREAADRYARPPPLHAALEGAVPPPDAADRRRRGDRRRLHSRLQRDDSVSDAGELAAGVLVG